MSFSTLEILPDEILMLIFQYSGNAITIFRTFLGLNQRFNNILLDQRLHLLTDYLSLKPLNIYYHSNELQQVTNQLLSVRSGMSEEKLGEILQSLYGYSIRQRYLEEKEKFELLCVKHQSVRQIVSHDDLRQADEKIKNEFLLLQTGSVTSSTVQRIRELVFTEGACLECDNYELSEFNLASGINDWILCYITRDEIQSKFTMSLYSQIIQILLISNPDLLNNRAYIGNGGCIVDFFLLCALLPLQYFYGFSQTAFVNGECFQIVLDLFFLTLYCRSKTDQNRYYLQAEMLHLLNQISMRSNNVQIQTTQFEIIKLTFEHIDIQLFPVDRFDDTIVRAVKHLAEIQRFDILKYLSGQILFENVFNTPISIRECINSLTRNRTSRQAFSMLLNDPSTSHLFAQQHVLFILLDKREHKFLKVLLKVSPNLVNQLDEQGNDPLLYITLNVRGCRHRIIETLIKEGCDPKRKNIHEQTFRDALQLLRNRKLLERLIEYEIIN